VEGFGLADRERGLMLVKKTLDQQVVFQQTAAAAPLQLGKRPLVQGLVEILFH
jgi:hypothetical protein